MPITESLAREKLRRFRGYAPLPVDEEDMRRLIVAFVGIASDPDHAERMTFEMEKSLHFYPKISDLHEASEAARNVEIPDFKGLGSKCLLCQDTGYTSKDRSDGISIATRCTCNPAKPEPEKARTGRHA